MKILYLLILLILSGCCCNNYGIATKTAKEIAKGEVLVSGFIGKVPNKGNISFLYYDGKEYRLVVYYCSINFERKSVYCSKLSDGLFDFKDNGRWYTSELFKKHVEHDSEYLEALKYISEEFLELSNSDKEKLLEKISSKNDETW